MRWRDGEGIQREGMLSRKVDGRGKNVMDGAEEERDEREGRESI